MKSTLRRIVSILVVMVLLAGALPVFPVYAAEEDAPPVTEPVIENDFPALDEWLEDTYNVALGMSAPEAGGFILPNDSPVGLTEGLTPQYGSNGKFLAPIELPAEGSIPISTRAQLKAITLNDPTVKYGELRRQDR